MSRKPSKSFIRTKEDFTCGHCGLEVKGSGYTNHCLRCLWSKHVDINPGDRAANCGGIMKPISVEVEKDSYIILHRCIKCGYEKKNTTSPNDDFEEIRKLIRVLPTNKKE